MTDEFSIGNLGPEKSGHLYRIGLAVVLTSVIVTSRPLLSLEEAILALSIGGLLGAVHTFGANGFTGPIRTAVERRDILIVVLAVVIGVLTVLFLPERLFSLGLYTAVGYMWGGSVTALGEYLMQ